MPSAARLPDDAERLAIKQHGYIGLDQLVAAGTTHGQLQGLLGRGDLMRVLPRTLRCRSANREWVGDAMAALLWAGGDAALSLGSCAKARGIDESRQGRGWSSRSHGSIITNSHSSSRARDSRRAAASV